MSKKFSSLTNIEVSLDYAGQTPFTYSEGRKGLKFTFLKCAYRLRCAANTALSQVPSSNRRSFAASMDVALQTAKTCLRRAQERMSKYAIIKRREVHFEVGQFVLLDGRNLHLKHNGMKKM